MAITETEVKERPILFSAPMVRALLEGRKTQTRRVVKFPSNIVADYVHKVVASPYYDHGARGEFVALNDIGGIASKAFSRLSFPCPYGVHGEKLWVREAWYYDLPPHKLPSEKPADFDPDSLYFRADGDCCQQIPECQCAEVGKPKWRPSIHLPRWASRLTLEITDVRVERVQAISEEDAIAEGIENRGVTGFDESMVPLGRGWMDCGPPVYASGPGYFIDPRQSYKSLWDSINGPGSWQSNPWVWAVTFTAVTP